MKRRPAMPQIRPGVCTQWVVEAPAGSLRRRLLTEWLARQPEAAATSHFLSCDFGFAGPWAGLADLIIRLLPEVVVHAPDLLELHAGELTLVLPSLRHKLQVLNPTLTDIASPAEKVRNYPLDRAYRIVHGVVNFMSAWSARRGAGPWIIVCDRFDDAGALVKMFFRELMRRRGRELDLTLILAVRPGSAGQITVAEGCERVELRWDLPEEEEPRPDPAHMADLARELEEQYRGDLHGMTESIPKLVYYWRNSDSSERALFWISYAFGCYNHFGLYEDALRYGGEVLRHLDSVLAAARAFSRWNLVGSLANCYLALKQPEKALAMVETEGLAKVDEAGDRSRIYYVLALIHSRFLPKPDFAQAEDYIAKGLEILKNADVPDHERYFLVVFLNNGLAYVRHRQGRPQEALDLCRRGLELLETHLLPDHHRLHRSVLVYNMAQVYAALREYDQAVAYYSAAMECDPNYSEYYNERGGALLSLGRLDEAIADFHKAIELSAPYQEVWTNLGQTYKKAGRLPEAVHAYSQALDLEPDRMLPRLGRAQAREALGHAREALADYTFALDRDAAQPLALANRATLWYELGELDKSAEDLDRAVALEPDNAEIRYNRAMVLTDLGRNAEAACELKTFLGLRPQCEERSEVEARIASIVSGGHGPRAPEHAPAQ